MTCRKVRRLIPLAAGGFRDNRVVRDNRVGGDGRADRVDLSPRRARAVRAHLAACPGCRAELEDLRTALDGFKAAAKAESVPDWSEGQWKALMARAVGQAKRAGDVSVPRAKPALRPRWAAASILGAFIGLAVLSVLFRGPSPRPDAAAGTDGAFIAAGPSTQDKLTMTIVSPDTGLQVVWILDKNFDYKGDRQ